MRTELKIRVLAGVAGLGLVAAFTGQSVAASHPAPSAASGSGTIKLKLTAATPIPSALKHATLCPYEFKDEYGTSVGKCAKLKHLTVTLKGVHPGKITVADKKMADRAYCDPDAIRVKPGKTTKATWTYTLPCVVSGGT